LLSIFTAAERRPGSSPFAKASIASSVRNGVESKCGFHQGSLFANVRRVPRRKTKVHGARRAVQASSVGPCCQSAGALVTLALGDPIVVANLRGFRRIRADGTYPSGEYVVPYGYVIPKGKCLVVTDLAYYSGFTEPQPPGNLTRVMLGSLTVTAPNSWTQETLFVTAPLFSQNGSIGGNVTIRSGFVITHGHYLTVDLFDSDLIETYVYVYGYLEDL